MSINMTHGWPTLEEYLINDLWFEGYSVEEALRIRALYERMLSKMSDSDLLTYLNHIYVQKPAEMASGCDCCERSSSRVEEPRTQNIGLEHPLGDDLYMDLKFDAPGSENRYSGSRGRPKDADTERQSKLDDSYDSTDVFTTSKLLLYELALRSMKNGGLINGSWSSTGITSRTAKARNSNR